MASSCPSYQFNLWFTLLSIVVVLLAAGSCSAARPARMLLATSSFVDRSFQEFKPHSRKHAPTGTLFNFFPKGHPVTPSGPSKHHNSVVNSAPRN